jgi:hypothetical protein
VRSHSVFRIAESRLGCWAGGENGEPWVKCGEDSQEWLSHVIAGIGGRELTAESSNFLPKLRKGWAIRRRFWGSRGSHLPVANSCLAGSAVSDCAHSVQNGTVLPLVLTYYTKMRKSDLTAKEWSSVPCPTCGVAPGEPCLLHSGALRIEPHVDRKLSAVEAIEANRISRGPGRP